MVGTGSRGRQQVWGLLLVMLIVALNPPALAQDDGRLHVVGGLQLYRAAYEDTLQEVARRFNVGFVELRAANPAVDPWLPGEGTEILLPDQHLLPDAPQEGVVINLGEMRLYHFREPGQPPETYPIGIGRDGFATPLGSTTVTRKAAGPSWYPTPRMRAEDPELPARVPPGPENPLGSHALYLGWPTYLIHGTNKPFGVGRRVSSGCIRLYPEDIERLYAAVPVGTRVTVVDQPVKLAWIGGQLYLEAHPSKEQADQIEIGEMMAFELPPGFSRQIVEVAADAVDRVDWQVVRTAAVERKGVPIRITR